MNEELIGMGNFEYQGKALRTVKFFPEGLHLGTVQADLLHAVLGVAGESGELVDGFKKHLIYGKPLDVENLREEAGDILWYLSLLFWALDTNFADVMAQNIEKLKLRYPDKYTDAAAIARADKAGEGEEA